MYMKIILLPVLLLFATAAGAQGVAIGNDNTPPDASAMLDIRSDSKGLLIPRLTQAQRNAIATPATGLLIYQTDATPGFYFNSGTPAAPAWTPLQLAAWLLTGNAGVNPATQFIGTTDNNALQMRTNNLLRMQVMPNGQVVINGTNRQSGQDALTVLGAGMSNVLTGFNYPINGYTGNTSTAGVYGENAGAGQGILGQNMSTGAGVYGINNSVGAGGIGVAGLSANNVGVRGQTNAASAAGVVGASINASGVGVIGLGNITAHNNIGAGTGVIGQGTNFGVIGYAATSASPVTTNIWGGYFDYLPGANTFAYIAGRSGTTDYGILSTGVKSTMVQDEEGNNRIMYCTEAPEVLFQDVGTGQLVNGRAHITIDPLLARNIHVSESKPLKVFIQLEGDCKGVFVTNKSAAGFDVVELQGGASNTPFTYQLIANRANSTDAAGRVVSRFADSRFPIGPARMGRDGRERIQTTQLSPLELPEKAREEKE